MKTTISDIVAEIRGLIKLLETLNRPLFESYLNKNRNYFEKLPFTETPEVYPELKNHSEKDGKIADSVILALVHDKILLDIKYIIASNDKNIDKNLFQIIQENIDQSVQFI